MSNKDCESGHIMAAVLYKQLIPFMDDIIFWIEEDQTPPGGSITKRIKEVQADFTLSYREYLSRLDTS